MAMANFATLPINNSVGLGHSAAKSVLDRGVFGRRGSGNDRSNGSDHLIDQDGSVEFYYGHGRHASKGVAVGKALREQRR